jgi:F-type H+-transporting ATPase subunit delta
MLDIAVARKYARALFEASTREGNAERVNADLEGLLALREEDPAFLGFLVSPEVPTDQKHAFIKAVFEPRLDPMMIGFLRLLVDKGRIVNLPEIGKIYRELTEKQRGMLRALVILAAALHPDQENRLIAELSRISGRKVILEKRMDPSILGGVVVHLGDKIIDRSVRGGLKTMSEALLAAGPR